MGREVMDAEIVVDEWTVALRLPRGASPARLRRARAEVTRELHELCGSLTREGMLVTLEG